MKGLGSPKISNYRGEREHGENSYELRSNDSSRAVARATAGWMSDLVSGLQKRLERFDSATGIQAARKWADLIFIKES